MPQDLSGLFLAVNLLLLILGPLSIWVGISSKLGALSRALEDHIGNQARDTERDDKIRNAFLDQLRKEREACEARERDCWKRFDERLRAVELGPRDQ